MVDYFIALTSPALATMQNQINAAFIDKSKILHGSQLLEKLIYKGPGRNEFPVP